MSTIGVIGSRFEADYSFSILKMHRVGLTRAISNPVVISLKNNCTVVGIDLETMKNLIVWVIPNFDLLDFSLWLVDLNEGPLVF